jgi:serine-aspartate repeat-containing protein C/D/E
LRRPTPTGYGNYKFTNLDPGTYRLVFDKIQCVLQRLFDEQLDVGQQEHIGSNDSIDSDVNGDGVSKHNVAYTDYTTLTSGENDMTWDAAITPIVIDLNGDGIKTISRANSDGTFDLFGNGGAVNSGWLSGEDGFLAVDANGNGKIDDISEMFGGLAKGDGFAKLASFDSNGDGVVDASDAAFASLKIWQDANGNHQTDAGELVSLTEAGVASLTVGYTELPFVDAQGNLHLERSNATLSDGSSVDMTDVYFNVSAEDAAAANVKLASLGQLVGDDSGLDGLLAGLGGGVGMGMSSCANAEMFDTAALDNLSRMAALYEEQAACCA